MFFPHSSSGNVRASQEPCGVVHYSSAFRSGTTTTKTHKMPVPQTIGTDPKQPSETIGYSLNHFALVVEDIDAIMRFYGEILGFRHIVTHEVSPTYHVTYMAYPSNQAGLQTGEEMLRSLRRREGLIEFLHPIGNGGLTSGCAQVHVKTCGFSHMGIVVPDVKAAEQRMKDFEVPILEALGIQQMGPGSEAAHWWGLDEVHAIEAVAGSKAMGFENILLVADPEGNVVELMES